ncbi:hypothetical protein KR044_009412 [Drosophila immigrans]|nr:hypothetical protein KR044_009412 [Drosophila immigrans]
MSKTVCVVCGRAAGLMCQRCSEPYCQDLCQRTDWQRHKYFCIIMPPLISARPLEQAAAEVSSAKSLEDSISNCSIASHELTSNDAASVVAKPEPKVVLSLAWRTNVYPNEKGFFECRVTYRESEDVVWVVESLNSERLGRLAHDMARSVQQKQPCHMQDIAVGDLVCISVDQKMYRGEIIKLLSDSNRARVRLIDMGIMAIIDIKNIYLALPLMAEINAYAFKVKLSQSNEQVQINQVISLRLLGPKTQDGIMQAEVKDPSIIALPLEMLAKNSGVIWLKTLQTNIERNEPQLALMQIKELSQLNEQLNFILKGDNIAHQFDKELLEVKHPFVLAARTEQGYRRAFLIDFMEQPAKYLIYEMDEGSLSIVNEVRRLPGEFFAFPQRSFAIMLPKSETVSLSELQDLSIELDGTRAKLLAQNEKVCAVRPLSFSGQIAKELKCKYFREPIANGSLVYITSVVSYHEIRISSVKTKEYSAIFKELEQKCAAFSNASEIAIGSIVLVVGPNRGPYRAETRELDHDIELHLWQVVSKLDNERYRVLNIDTGNHHLVAASHLRMSCAFLEHLPVSLCRSSIKTICNIPSTAVPQNTIAFNLLMKSYEKKTEMEVQFSDSKCSTLDLIDLNVEPHSLMTRMLPVMFTPSTVELQPAENIAAVPVSAPEVTQSSQGVGMPISALPPLPPSPPSTPTLEGNRKHTKRYFFDDIKRELLPLNVEISLMILSAVDMHKTGYVTGCYLSDEKAAEDFQNLLNRVAEVGFSDNLLFPGYLPDVGEMCLAVFSEDDSWYRGVCLKVSGSKAHILFCDYGNMEMVSIEKIKPIPPNLVKPIFATKCLIEGFDKSANFKILEDYLTAKNKINCIASSGLEPNTCVLRIPTLDKILSQELV